MTERIVIRPAQAGDSDFVPGLISSLLLAVSEDARRMGVGQALMQAGEAWARGRGLTVLSLDVWSTNQSALAFYRTLGYRPESLCLIKALD